MSAQRDGLCGWSGSNNASEVTNPYSPENRVKSRGGGCYGRGERLETQADEASLSSSGSFLPALQRDQDTQTHLPASGASLHLLREHTQVCISLMKTPSHADQLLGELGVSRLPHFFFHVPVNHMVQRHRKRSLGVTVPLT